MLKLTPWLMVALLLAMNLAQAQESAAAPPATPREAKAAAAADVASPEAIIQAVYSVISGPKGAARDWPRLRSLMAPGGIFAVTGKPPAGPLRTRVISLEDFISGSSKALEAEAFYEHGVVGTVWRYAHIATLASPYESRRAPGEAPFQRGINTFQLSYDGTRWWIVSIAWEAETPAFPLPAKDDALLKSK
jgi:hypothetical protein